MTEPHSRYQADLGTTAPLRRPLTFRRRSAQSRMRSCHVGLRAPARAYKAGMAVLVLGVVAACDNGAPTQAQPCVGVSELVSGEAAAALDTSGCFVFPPPAALPRATLTEQKAKDLAAPVAAQFGPLLLSYLQAGHGGAIDLSRLQVCGPTYYAESPYQPLPAAVPSAYQNAFGPSWVLLLCGQNGVPQVSVSVAAYATYLQLAGNHVEWPPATADVYGNEILLVGALLSWRSGLPIEPEQAVRLAYQATGKRIIEIPHLYRRDPAFAFPQGAMWALRLERQIRIRDSLTATERMTDTVYVGLANPFAGRPGDYTTATLQVASAAQPRTAAAVVPADYSAATAPPGTGAVDSVYRRPEVPVNYQSAVIVP